MITTITSIDEGEILLNGERLNSNHPNEIGYMPEERGLYKKMKVGEHLLYLARLKGLSKQDARNEIDFWIQKFDIADWYTKRVEDLSKGMQQKVQFIATVVHKPKLLILDEPFSGLDPINSNLLKDVIYDLNKQGTTIMFSTHRMEQVEEICQKMVLINKGRIVLEGEVQEVKERFKKNQYHIVYKGALPDQSLQTWNVEHTKPGEMTVRLNNNQNPNDLVRHLLDYPITLVKIEELFPSLNEIFIQAVEQSNHPVSK